jgi:hypothetical protein
MEVTPGHRLDPRISPRVIWVGRQIVDVAVLRIGSNIIDLGLSYQSYEGKACAPSSVLFELAMHLKRERHSVGAVDGSVAAEELWRSLKVCQMKRCRNEMIKIEMPFRQLKNKIETAIETAPRSDRNVNLECPYYGLRVYGVARLCPWLCHSIS